MPLTDVDAAVAAGLLHPGASGGTASTPSGDRAAMHADLSPVRRREPHARAANVVSRCARLTHRVAASVGPDEALGE